MRDLPDGKPKLVREAVTRMLIRLRESRSAILHALIELISLDEVVKPNYWKKTPGGVLWSPSVAVQERLGAAKRGPRDTSQRNLS